MIDQSTLKAPGWQRVVAELQTPAPDDATFLARLVAVLGQVSSARQAVLFAVERETEDTSAAEPRPLVVWPPSPDNQPSALEFPIEARNAARAAAETAQVRVFGLEAGAGFYGEQDKGFVIAVPVHASSAEPGVAPRAVVTLIIEKRSKPAIQSTVAMVELIAGYTALHASRQQLRRAKSTTAALDLASRLIASTNTSATFKGATMQLVNDLSRQIRADRVALGWVQGIGGSGAVRVVAVSDTELVDRRMAMIQKLEAAMDECLDQEQPVLYPPPPARADGSEADVLLSQAITHAHRELASADARLKVISLPLRVDDRVEGVLTIESNADGPADIASVELIQASLDLIAPILMLRRSDDRPLYKRAYASTIKAGEWVVGAKHTAWKLVAIALMLLLVGATFIHVPYRIEAPVELEARLKQLISVPFDGNIASVPAGIEPGRTVTKGDVLVEMNTEEMRLQLADARARLLQAETEADQYRREDRYTQAAQAEARAAQARAHIAMAELKIQQARMVAPIDGTIIAGDVKDKVGATVRLGDVLFQIAPLESMTVIARVSDSDIGLLRDSTGGSPTSGELITKAFPNRGFPFTVERIVPLSQPKEGKNVFEVRGVMETSAAWLRPGMEGLAKFDTGRHSLMWIGTRRIRDQLRLWLWW